MNRCWRVGLVSVVVGALALIPAGPVGAEPAHTDPGAPAKRAFAAGFPALVDHEWGFPLGGFGGSGPGARSRHVPVIFVHGNNVDAADWYPVRDDFRAAGWTDQELWALSYGGRGGQNGTALTRSNPERDAEHTSEGFGPTWVTNNDVNLPDLYDFILAVRTYTGSKRFSVIGHSLGVTLARKVLKVHPGLRADLVAFVGIAGGNHGTTFCPPGSEGNVVSCNEIAAGTPWLAELNGPGGNDETYPPAKWLTVYDGSGAGDPAYVGPTYAQSPALKGHSENVEKPNTYHNDLRLDPGIVKEYRAFVEAAEVAPATPAPDAQPRTPRGSAVAVTNGPAASPAARRGPDRLPETGGADGGFLGGALLVGFVLVARQRRRVAGG